MLLLLIPLAFADTSIINSNSLSIDLDISSAVTLQPASSNYNVEYLTVNLSFFPQDALNQKVTSIETIPKAGTAKGYAVYTWNNPAESKLTFSLKSNILTESKSIEVKNKIRFPLSNLPDDVLIYTKPSETVDSNNKQIIELASRLAEGNDDIFVVVNELAKWTKENIEYDLSTLTESVSQPASWVLENREGVCDELTNLFIALCRSLKIPAKFISGIAYSSDLVTEDFGPHGWAEVYFPGYGWVPFDITYGEFGFIDATHIKLKESIDAKEPSTQYQWLGRSIELLTEPLSIKADVKESSGKAPFLTSLKIEPLKNPVGFGSYNLVEVQIENLQGYYVAEEIALSKPKEVGITGEPIKNILLKPKEKKSAYYIIKVIDDLRKSYSYSFPLVVSTSRNNTAQAVLDSKNGAITLALNEVKEHLSALEEKEEKTAVEGLGISCGIEEKEFSKEDQPNINCTLKNTGNFILEGLSVCLQKDCKNLGLGITEEKTVSFRTNFTKIGRQEASIRAYNSKISKTAYVEFTLLDKPSITISDLEYREQLQFDEKFNISFLLTKESVSNPQEVVLLIKENSYEKKWVLGELKESQAFAIDMKGSELSSARNHFTVMVQYKDAQQKKYEAEQTFNITVSNLTSSQKIRLFFNKLKKGLLSILS